MSLKKSLILLLLFFPLLLNAQEKYSNRWKEVKRTDRQGKLVSYTDTMLINNVTKENLKMRRGSFEYTGTISNDLLEVGEDQYQMIQQNETEIRVGDEKYVHIFARELKDQSAADATASINEKALPEKPVNSIDTKLLDGQWQAYKRQRKDGKPGKMNYGMMIKTVSFMASISQNGYDYVLTDNGTKFSIKAFKDSNIIVTDDNKTEHLIIVWKLTKEELIIEDENGLLYYMKQF